jgi:hypothetical protein
LSKIYLWFLEHNSIYKILIEQHIQAYFRYVDDILIVYNSKHRSRVSSGSIVSDYGLNDRAIGVRSPAGAKESFSILCVQTGSGAHPASCTMSTGGKAQPGRDSDHSPPSSAEVVNE